MSASAAKNPEPDEEAELDRVIAKIDRALPLIHEKVKDSQQRGETPTGAFDLRNLRKTQQAFEALSGDPVLSKSDEDALARARAKLKASSRILRFRSG